MSSNNETNMAATGTSDAQGGSGTNNQARGNTQQTRTTTVRQITWNLYLLT